MQYNVPILYVLKLNIKTKCIYLIMFFVILLLKKINKFSKIICSIKMVLL